MTELAAETLELLAADLGPENPLPRFRGRSLDRQVRVAPDVPEEDRGRLGWRAERRVLPHRLQDAYGRDLRPREFRALSLENELLRAVFLPELGGRLASLFDKRAGRELLEPVAAVRFGNLALRDAWFSGGVEWNTAQPGHYFLTASPVFAARLELPGGEPVLRLYEWDRLKCFPWQIDFRLPPGSKHLFARVRLTNPHDRELAMYWWTNLAVPEAPGVRVLAPASDALRYAPAKGISLVGLPEWEGHDGTYPAEAVDWGEYFFRVPHDRRPWIAVVEESGRGLVETSTARLRGRKMFCWGTGPGGRRWQARLEGPGRAYFEIQAGLARTQVQCLPMPARTEWTWTEAFGPFSVAPRQAHDPRWERAWTAAEGALAEQLPAGRVEEVDRELAALADAAPAGVLLSGSGWGALERRRLAARGRAERLPAGAVFDDASLGPDQEPWLALLERGEFPEPRSVEEPGAWMVQAGWRELLAASQRAGRSGGWLAWLHLGHMLMEKGDERGARQAWEKSLQRRETSWALRNLGVLEMREDRLGPGADLLLEAWKAGPRPIPLALECARALLSAERYADLREFAAGLPGPVRGHERVAIALAKAALEVGDLGEVERLLAREFSTIREGETTLTDLWFALQEKRLAAAEGLELNDELRARVRREFPPPEHLEFRMRTG